MKLKHLDLLVEAVVRGIKNEEDYLIIPNILDCGGDPYIDRLLLAEVVRKALEEA